MRVFQLCVGTDQMNVSQVLVHFILEFDKVGPVGDVTSVVHAHTPVVPRLRDKLEGRVIS